MAHEQPPHPLGHPTSATRLLLIAAAILDFVLLVIFSILALDDQQHFDWAEWWDYHFTHYSFATSFFDLILVSLCRSFSCFIVGLDCFAPCCSRMTCCGYGSDPTSPALYLKVGDSETAGLQQPFEPQRQLYSPLTSKFSRVSALALAIFIMLGNLPFLLIKILVFQNDPFSLFYMLCLLSALCMSVFEAPLLLKLWLLKRRIHGLRNLLRTNFFGGQKHDRAAGKESKALLTSSRPKQQLAPGSFPPPGGVAGSSAPDDPGFVDFYYFTDTSGDEDYDTDNDDIATDEQGLPVPTNSSPSSSRPVSVPQPTSHRKRWDTERAGSIDSFRTPQGSFVSAREALSDTETEEFTTPATSFAEPSRFRSTSHLSSAGRESQ